MKRYLMLCAGLFAVMLFSVSLDCATELTWIDTEIIENNDGYNASDVQVAVDGNVAVAVWKQSDGSYSRIYTNYSNDGGATWHSSLRIDDNGGNDAGQPQVAVSGSNVVVVWYQYNGVGNNIYADYSTDGGATWHSDQLVEIDSGNAAQPQVAINGINVVAVWRQYDGTLNNSIYAAYSTDGGGTWNSAGAIENVNRSAESPKIAMDGSNVVAVWYQYDSSNDYRIYSNYSSNSGQTWGVSAQLIENNSGYDGYLPEVAISGNNVVAVWSQYNASGYRHIYSNYSTNAGQTWIGDQQVEYNTYQAEYQKVAINGSNAVLVWRQDDGVEYGIYSSYSTNGGATWAPNQLIEDNSGQANGPDITMSSTTVVAVWYQNDGTTYRIYSNVSTDGGATWASDKIVDDNDGYSANNPQVAIYGDVPVAVWYQYDGANNRVYSNYAEFIDVPTGSSVTCFIATAAFGTPMAEEVLNLRNFRDRHMLTNRTGRAFVRWYYRHSPSLADYIRNRPLARAMVRTALRPIAWLVSLR